MLQGFSYDGRCFCLYGKQCQQKQSCGQDLAVFLPGDGQGLHRSRFGKELRSRKGSRNGWFCLLFMFLPYKKSKNHCLLQRCWSYINWCCFNWHYDFWKLMENATISCLLHIFMLHMEFPPLHNSHPPINTALINLIENHQQGMLEMIFKLIENGFQLSYWKIYTYLC